MHYHSKHDPHKTCIICGEYKSIRLFYKHSEMSDGHLNKCIECTKQQAKARHYKLRKDPEWVNAERERGRDKYHRLGYYAAQTERNKNKLWTKNSRYKNLRRQFKIPKQYELHHWSYQKHNITDVFILQISDHKRIHKILHLKDDELCFIDNNGVILDTKEKHRLFLIKNNIPVYNQQFLRQEILQT